LTPPGNSALRDSIMVSPVSPDSETSPVTAFPKSPGRPAPDDTPPAPPALGFVAQPDTDWSDLRPDVICVPTTQG